MPIPVKDFLQKVFVEVFREGVVSSFDFSEGDLEVSGGVVFMSAEGIGEALEVDQGGADLSDGEAQAFGFFVDGEIRPGAGAIGLCGWKGRGPAFGWAAPWAFHFWTSTDPIVTLY